MNINFTQIKNRAERKKVQGLYNASVPKHEKAYFYPLWWKRKRNGISFVSICDDSKWVGFIFYSICEDLIYIWFFATLDSRTSKAYDAAMLAKLQDMHPQHRIAISIEAENESSDNAEKSLAEKMFYKGASFAETGYFVRRKTDSFEIMLAGSSFDIDELYRVNKAVYPFLSKFIIADMKKQIKKR